MESIKDNYRARAASFENTEDWQKYIHSNADDWIAPEGCSEKERREYGTIHDNIIRNCYLIRYFADDLRKSGKLTEKTIQKHEDNISFYLNTFAAEETGANAEQALKDSTIHEFMSYFFPRKTAWCSAENIKSNCASLNKFGTWMNANDLISDEDLMDMKQFIREWKGEWIEACEDMYEDLW